MKRGGETLINVFNMISIAARSHNAPIALHAAAPASGPPDRAIYIDVVMNDQTFPSTIIRQGMNANVYQNERMLCPI
jgi:hypothetical protein